MGSPAEFEARLAAVEARLEEVAADAAAARHLAAARDRDLADLTVKVDANRSAINGLGVQTVARFDRLENKVDTGFAEMRAKFGQIDARFDQIDAKFDQIDAKFDMVDAGFMEMRAKFDQTAAGMQQIVELLTRRDDQA